MTHSESSEFSPNVIIVVLSIWTVVLLIGIGLIYNGRLSHSEQRIRDLRSEFSDYRIETRGELSDLRVETWEEASDDRIEAFNELSDFRIATLGELRDLRMEIGSVRSELRSR